MTTTLSKEEVVAQVSDLRNYGAKLEKAIDAVIAGGVKAAVFLPSGRKVATVVGRMGDEFIDPERPYCSCSSFFFQAQAGKDPVCYHLLAQTIARRLGMTDVVEFSDDEYGAYLTAAVHDVFDVLGKSGG